MKNNNLLCYMMHEIENLIDDNDLFEFYYLNDFVNLMRENVDVDDFDFKFFEKTLNKYNCNINNTIVLLQNIDDDMYLIVNVENDTYILTQNYDICDINNEYANFNEFKHIFQKCVAHDVKNNFEMYDTIHDFIFKYSRYFDNMNEFYDVFDDCINYARHELNIKSDNENVIVFHYETFMAFIKFDENNKFMNCTCYEYDE